MTTPRDSANGLILQDAFVYKAPVGTALPTDVDTPLPATWDSCGWLDQDGVTQTPQGSTTELKGVTGATLAYIKDGDGFQYGFNCVESNAATASLLSPNSTVATATGVTTRTRKASTAPPEEAFVIEEHYSNGSKRRIAVARGTAVCGAVKSVYTDFRKFPVTISAIQQADGTLDVDITDNAGEAVA